MTTRKAPGAWGRGRTVALTTAFVIMMMLALCLAPAAFAVPKSSDADAPGASGSAPGHTGELPATANAEDVSPGQPAVQPADPPASGAVLTASDDSQAGSTPPEDAEDPAPKDRTKVWEPNQPVSDKYDGPCTRHEDTYRKGAGHDWHRGVGVGHSGVRPSEEPTESLPPTDTPPPSEPETDGPSGEDTPTAPADDEPFRPYTPTQAPTQAAATAVSVAKQTAREKEAYLPYTGGDAGHLLLLAAGLALAGGGLRGYGRTRLHSHRRIAR